jgi:murein DD-endopeptidase MepM/ murein hydrolase activator NlpD
MKQLIAQLRDPRCFLGLLFILVFLSTLTISLIGYQQPKWLNTNFEQKDISFVTPLAALQSKSVTIKAGDTWSTLFQSLNLDLNLLHKILKLEDVKKHLTPLKINQTFSFNFHHHILSSIKTTIDAEHTLTINNDAGTLSTKVEQLPITSKLTYAQGTITDSFIDAAHQAGLSNVQAFQMAHIFQSKLNFSTSIKKGDHFEVLYQNNSLDGKPLKQKPLAAIKFYTKDHVYTAIRFTNKADKTYYYDEEGRGIQPALLRIPLHYRRISSSFNKHRFHPILHIYRPHLGTDFAARTGTPVKSVGDGQIISIRSNTETGKMIKVRYNQHYVAVYAHLAKFAKNLHLHSMVSKGQVIGYVGSTGLSTGPHLHYGVYINGQARNPMTVPLPGVDAVSSSEKETFSTQAKSMLSLLSLHHIKNIKAEAV